MPAEKSIKQRRHEALAEILKAHGESDECLIWPYNKHRQGYGLLYLPGVGGVYAHRYAFFLTHDRWPTDKCLHKCDNPPCFNPRHLSEGSQRENVLDMFSKGRGNRCNGIRHAMVTLTEQQVREIREKSHIPRWIVAKEYGIGTSQVQRIVHRESWKHLI